MSRDSTPASLSATEAARKIRGGELTSEELVQSCLDRIEELEDGIGAWTHLNKEYALAQAKAAHELRQSGGSLGPLHGVPVGIKDIFDTHDMPTEKGTILHAGRQPESDSTVVSLLRRAGAVIMGKTVTTELAVFHPGKTRNPHDPARTPGGSSSGSAAAVAAGMVPLAVGTQTNGSMIRPAAFCGVYGYKPTHGLISRHGVLLQSRVLDTVGVYGRALEDVALIAECLTAFDDRDPDMKPASPPHLSEVAAEEPPAPPAIAFVKTPVWDRAETDTQEAFAELADHLGENCEQVDLPEPFDQAIAWLRTIMVADQARAFADLYARGRDRLSDVLRGMIEEGQAVRAVAYTAAVDGAEVLNAGLARIFEDYDAIVTPATRGEAPLGLESTGDPVFCTLWTLCGTPAISLPLLRGAAGMPMGVQLVGARGDDARLLRTARWLVGRVQ